MCYTIKDMPTWYILKVWRRDQATGRGDLSAQQTWTFRLYRPKTASDRPECKQHPTKGDVDTDPGPDYRNFIGYFNYLWKENINQVHQYFVVYPDDKRKLSQMRVHSSNGETIQ